MEPSGVAAAAGLATAHLPARQEEEQSYVCGTLRPPTQVGPSLVNNKSGFRCPVNICIVCTVDNVYEKKKAPLPTPPGKWAFLVEKNDRMRKYRGIL